jgi:hypothetical protein
LDVIKPLKILFNLVNTYYRFIFDEHFASQQLVGNFGAIIPALFLLSVLLELKLPLSFVFDQTLLKFNFYLLEQRYLSLEARLSFPQLSLPDALAFYYYLLAGLKNTLDHILFLLMLQPNFHHCFSCLLLGYLTLKNRSLGLVDLLFGLQFFLVFESLFLLVYFKKHGVCFI